MNFWHALDPKTVQPRSGIAGLHSDLCAPDRQGGSGTSWPLATMSYTEPFYVSVDLEAAQFAASLYIARAQAGCMVSCILSN